MLEVIVFTQELNATVDEDNAVLCDGLARLRGADCVI